MPMIQTFPTASGSGSGHIIKDKDGISMATEKNLQFKGLLVTDNSTDETTEIEGEGLNQDSIDDITSANTINPAVIIGDAFNYSTSEKIVGKWIDGKPLYQRTLVMASSYTSEVAIPNNGTGVSVTGISNIFMSDIKPTLNKIIHIEMDTNNRIYSGSSYSHYYPFRFNADNGNVSTVDNYNVGYNENIALYPGTSFTFRYTKTTD